MRSIISSMPTTGMTPVWRKNPSQIRWLPPSEAVWLATARLPSAVSPPFQMKIGLRSEVLLATSKRRLPSRTPSM